MPGLLGRLQWKSRLLMGSYFYGYSTQCDSPCRMTHGSWALGWEWSTARGGCVPAAGKCRDAVLLLHTFSPLIPHTALLWSRDQGKIRQRRTRQTWIRGMLSTHCVLCRLQAVWAHSTPKTACGLLRPAGAEHGHRNTLVSPGPPVSTSCLLVPLSGQWEREGPGGFDFPSCGEDGGEPRGFYR